MPSAEHLTVSLSACKARFMALEGCCSVLSAQKSFKGPRLGVARRNRGEKSYPDEESLICPSGRLMIFYKNKHCVSVQTYEVWSSYEKRPYNNFAKV